MKGFIIFAAIAVITTNCGPSKEALELQKKAKLVFGTLPKMMPGSEKDTPERVALGEKLYFETKLSSDNSMSCNTCHNVSGKAGGVDNKPTSKGVLGKNGDRNSPTVLHAGLHVAQFWDGRAKDLQAQAKGPILNPVEMNMPSAAEVEKKLSQDPEYVSLFAKAFPGEAKPLNYENLAEAIASFERTLFAKSKFDDFLEGDAKALNAAELKGLETFMTTGCTSCHSGNVFGGKMFQKLGLVNAYTTGDLGRYNVTKAEADKLVFKVPSLRNIAITGPYFHDGSIETLETAVEKMGYHQLGKNLSSEEVSSIVAFLKTLTDKNRL